VKTLPERARRVSLTSGVGEHLLLQVGWALFGWLITLPCAGLVAAAVFSLIAYSPKALPASQTQLYPLESAGPPLVDVALQSAGQGVCVVSSDCNPVHT